MKSMTIYEAIEIRNAIKTKQSIEAFTAKIAPRMNDSYVNLLAGLTESWCRVNDKKMFTRRDLDNLWRTYKTHSRSPYFTTEVREVYKAKSISCEKILEQWKENIDDESIDVQFRPELQGELEGDSKTEESQGCKRTAGDIDSKDNGG